MVHAKSEGSRRFRHWYDRQEGVLVLADIASCFSFCRSMSRMLRRICRRTSIVFWDCPI